MLSSGVIGLIFGGVIGMFSPLLFALVLYIIGFGCIGITLGSCASKMMSIFHPIGSGSIYACESFNIQSQLPTNFYFFSNYGNYVSTYLTRHLFWCINATME